MFKSTFSSLFVLCVVLSGCNSHPSGERQSTQRELKPFLFKKISADTTLNGALNQRIISDCNNDGDGEVSCKLVDARIGEVESDPVLTWVFFSGGKFDWLSIEVTRDQYPKALDAIRSAYGTPCKTGTTELQNGFGAQFASEEARWCFSDGVLIFSEISQRNSNFSDLALHRFKAPDPPKKFSPKDI
jgi:hypothetical protein